MSEPRKINIGGGHRSTPGNAQNVYHAGDAQAASGRTVNTLASRSDDAAREAARRRYEQQRAASQRGYRGCAAWRKPVPERVPTPRLPVCAVASSSPGYSRPRPQGPGSSIWI